MYDGLNVGKRNVTFNLKHPDAVALVRRLVVEWADAVARELRATAMKGFGLDYDTLAAIKPDLVMISACLNGQTGPHKDYPGFGGQGAALVRATTGSPAGPTASPSARTARSPTRSRPATSRPRSPPGLHYRAPHRPRRVPRRLPGRGGHLDALARGSSTTQTDGVVGVRDGNRSRARRAARRVPVRRRGRRRRPVGGDRVLDRRRVGARSPTIIGVDDPSLATLDARRRGSTRSRPPSPRGRATATRPRSPSCCRAPASRPCRSQDFGDVHDDPQLAAREHFVPLTHPFMGAGLYERNGFRLSDAPSGLRPCGADPRPGQRLRCSRGSSVSGATRSQRSASEGAVE